MHLPKYKQNNSQERLGVNAVAQAIAKIGQIWRETPMTDVGIDGQIEYVSQEGFATGRMIAVQIKSGESFFNEKNENWIFYPEAKHRFYWERFPLPVIIIIHNPDTEFSYWQDVRQAIRTVGNSNAKGILVPKANVLQKTSAQTLFEMFSVLDQDFMTIDGVLGYLIKTQNNNASLPISYFNLFCSGLINFGRSLYFGMDLVINISESILARRRDFGGAGLGSSDHDFLFNYIKFIVHQHIADVDFSDCMIDWFDRHRQPTFMAALTSRGKELIKRIYEIECQYKDEGKISETGDLHAAQAGIMQLLFSSIESNRIALINELEHEFLKENKY